MRDKKGRFKKNNIPWNKNLKGIHLSLATEFKKGCISLMQGKKHSEKSKKKMGLSHRIENLSTATQLKMSKSHQGKKIPLRIREKMSEAQLGEKHHIFGKTYEEAYGKEKAQLIKKKLRLAHKDQKISKDHLRKSLRRNIPSSLEAKFQNIIDKYNVPYKYTGNGSFIIGHYNPDFVNINNEKIAIEVYAKYFKLRNNKTIEEWKEERNKVFAKYGWKVIYFDETELNDEKNVLSSLNLIDGVKK